LQFFYVQIIDILRTSKFKLLELVLGDISPMITKKTKISHYFKIVYPSQL
jgi:hypothetical protein